jgi:hypothetical protein
VLELLLKAPRPGTYKDRVVNERCVGTQPIDLLPEFTDDELIALLRAKRRSLDEDECDGRSRGRVPARANAGYWGNPASVSM